MLAAMLNRFNNEAPPVGGSKWFAHLPIREVGGGGISGNLLLSSDLLKSKIPICRGGGGLRNLMFRFAKIENSHLWGEGEVCRIWGLVEPISNF